MISFRNVCFFLMGSIFSAIACLTFFSSFSLSSPPPPSRVETEIAKQDTSKQSAAASSMFSAREQLRSIMACGVVDDSKNRPDVASHLGSVPRIAFLGDSIVYGNGTHAGTKAGWDRWGTWPMDFVAKLQERYDAMNEIKKNKNNYFTQKYQVFDARNFGVRSTSLTCPLGAITKFDNFRKAVAFKPHVVFIAFGSNDQSKSCVAFSSSSSENQHVGFTPTNFERRLNFVIDSFLSASSSSSSSFSARSEHSPKSAKSPLVILLTPPPMLRNSLTIEKLQMRLPVLKHVIVPIIRGVAARRRLPLVDVFRAWHVNETASKGGYLAFDGMHPNSEGADELAEMVTKVVCCEREC